MPLLSQGLLVGYHARLQREELLMEPGDLLLNSGRWVTAPTCCASRDPESPVATAADHLRVSAPPAKPAGELAGTVDGVIGVPPGAGRGGGKDSEEREGDADAADDVDAGWADHEETIHRRCRPKVVRRPGQENASSSRATARP